MASADDAGVFDPLDKGLRRNALGLSGSTVIGLASTAPAYGLAAAVPALAAVAGVQAPGVLLLAAVPMLLVALAFRELNLHEPDAGTTFAWVSRAFGPRVGWLGGWALFVACVLVLGSLAQVATQYLFLLVGADRLATNRLALVMGGLIWLVILTLICERGIAITARAQGVLVLIELVLLAAFAVAALVNAPAASAAPAASWFNPFTAPGDGLAGGLLLAVFLYWGWDTCFSVNEETRAPTRVPGAGALLSIGLLIVTFLLVTTAVVAYAGPARAAAEGGDDVFAAFATSVLGSAGGRLLVFAILTSAVAGALTTLLPTARTLLAMGAFGALPPAFGQVSARTSAPIYATVVTGVASAVIFVLFVSVSENALADSVEATALAICFYYGITAAAVPWYFRHHLQGARNLLLRAIVPGLGALSMLVLLIRSCVTLANPDNTSSTILGIGTPLVVGVVALVLGVVVMLGLQGRETAFFRGKLAGPGDVDADGRIRLRDQP